MKNIEEKLKSVAKVVTILGIACMIIGACLAVFAIPSGEEYMLIPGCAGIVLGIPTYISSFVIYAFAQITEDIHAMRENGAQK